ncbi:MAG TPA: hypothetical protein VNS58_17720 [Puia sp.]|nr:hypothetical protein [Puia sp.]
MKLSFSRKGKRQTDSRYAVVKAGLPDAQWQLYTALLSASLDESFYQLAGGNGSPAGDNLDSLRERIGDNDPAFVAKLAVYLREKMNLRLLSLIVTAELAAFYGDSEWIGSLIARVLPQAGDIPEWMDYYTRANKGVGSLSRGELGPGAGRPGKAVLRGLASVCNRLDEYQFTRHPREEQLKLRKALLLIRPKAKDKAQRVLFGKIAKDRLPARTTWHQELNVLQQQKYDSLELQQATLRDKWKEGISSFRIGYAALVDHLPEILAAGVSGKVLKRTAEYLGNAAAIAGSGISPYRFPEVYRKLQSMDQGGAPMLLDALEQAIRHSARNLAGFEEKSRSVIAMDVSNSMKRPVSEGSDIQRFDIAPLLAMLLRSRGKQVTTGIIGNTWKGIDLPAQGILAGMEPFRGREGEVGYAINSHLVIQDLLKKGQIVDKVMIFTDCRLWDNRVFHQPAGTDLSRVWKSYRQIAPEAKLYLFNLAGYGNRPLEVLKDDVFLISGWNDRIFDVLRSVGKEGHTLEAISQIAI